MASKPKAEKVPQEVWDLIEVPFKDIYMKTSLEDSRLIINRHFKLTITKRQYVKQVKKWNLPKYSTRRRSPLPTVERSAQDALQAELFPSHLLDARSPLHLSVSISPRKQCEEPADTSPSAIPTRPMSSLLAISCEHTWSRAYGGSCPSCQTMHPAAAHAQPQLSADVSHFAPASAFETSHNSFHVHHTSDIESNNTIPVPAPRRTGQDEGSHHQKTYTDTHDSFGSSWKDFETVSNSPVSQGRLENEVPENNFQYY